MTSTKLTIIISFVMMITSVFGVVLMQTKSTLSWTYFQSLSVFNAALCIFLGCYHRHMKKKQTLGTVWHELLHWIGFLLCVFIVTKMVEIGLFSRYAASLMIMILLGFSTFIAGVYVDLALLFVGALIGFASLVLAFFNEYLYPVFIPIIAILLIGWIVSLRFTHKKGIKG